LVKLSQMGPPHDKRQRKAADHGRGQGADNEKEDDEDEDRDGAHDELASINLLKAATRPIMPLPFARELAGNRQHRPGARVPAHTLGA